MRNQTESVQDTSLRVIPGVSWRVVEVHTFPGARLAVKFMDGMEGEVDMSWLVMSDHAGVFIQLRGPVSFPQPMWDIRG